MGELDRREFAGSVLAVALLPVLGPGALPIGPWWEPVTAAAGNDPDALAKVLGEVVRVQYGSRLGESDLATIVRQIRDGLERAEAMRKVDLTNGDEPDFIFLAGAESQR